MLNLNSILMIAVVIVVNVGLGFFWYSGAGFGRTWMRLMKIDSSKAPEGMGESMAMGIGSSIVGVVALSVVFRWAAPRTLTEVLLYALVWILAFPFPIYIGHIAWERRPAQLVAINFAWTIVSILLTSLIFFFWPW